MNNNLRLGFSETTLLFLYYLDQKNISNEKYVTTQNEMINFFCSTSGFYDKEIIGSYFDFDAEKIKHSKVYNEYFNELFSFFKDNNSYLELCYIIHLDKSVIQYKEEFEQIINFKKFINKPSLFNFMENKNILIINNLGSLMKKQFESGNMNKIHSNFPNNIKSIQYFENGYTFLNSGPDSSILETSKKICNQIQNYNFDGVIVSAGAYSCLIAKFIIKNLKKPAYVIGGDLTFYFGIISNRTKTFHKNSINEYYIEVPAEMRPLNYEKIEGGCYW